MNKDRNFERRMIVSKYSNRPPFDLKKPTEIDDIAEKMKAYPDESCKSCCKNKAAQNRDPPRINKFLPPPDSSEESKIPPARRIIPKIIKKFQKLTPAINLTEDLTISQNASIQTLYRSTKPRPLGKNIPKHRLMKSLLQNFDSEKSLSRHKPLPCRSGIKHKKNRKLFFNEGETIRPDFQVNLDLKAEPSTSIQALNEYKSNTSYNTPQKVDKRTSTTGLLWPPKSREMFQYSSLHIPSNQRVNRQKMVTTRFGETNEFSSKSYLEELPTKDMSQPKKGQLESDLYGKKFGFTKNEATDNTRQISRIPLNPEKRSVFQTNPESKEKTFVQVQVEKLDKVLGNVKPNNNPIPKFGNRNKKPNPKNLEREHVTIRGQKDVSKKEGTVNYIGLMNKIKTNCPHLEDPGDYHNVDNDHEWSDMNDTEITPHKVKFPRETRMAINQFLSEKKQLQPLSRFGRIQENCSPAIISSLRPVEVSSHLNQEGDYEGEHQQVKHKTVKSVDIRHNRHKLSLPCKKNLLCDKGDQHLGPCGYTHNCNKVVY